MSCTTVLYFLRVNESELSVDSYLLNKVKPAGKKAINLFILNIQGYQIIIKIFRSLNNCVNPLDINFFFKLFCLFSLDN